MIYEKILPELIRYRCFWRVWNYKGVTFTIYHWEWFFTFPFHFLPKCTLKDPYVFSIDWGFFDVHRIRIVWTGNVCSIPGCAN